VPELGRLLRIAHPRSRPHLDGASETTRRVRQLVDGLEAALARGDDLGAVQFLAPPLQGRLLAIAAAMKSGRGAWLPARSGLRWSQSRRHPDGPGLLWLRLQFEDLTRCEYPDGGLSAPLRTFEVEAELETLSVPWRLYRVLERSAP
jgi:hypothetical protein